MADEEKAAMKDVTDDPKSSETPVEDRKVKPRGPAA